MHRSLEGIAKRAVDHLMLLHHRLAFEGTADDGSFKMITITLDLDLGRWYTRFDQFFYVVCLHFSTAIFLLTTHMILLIGTAFIGHSHCKPGLLPQHCDTGVNRYTAAKPHPAN